MEPATAFGIIKKLLPDEPSILAPDPIQICSKEIEQMVTDQNRLKICLVASAGGHLTQLLKLADSWADYEAVYITTTEVVRKKLGNSGKVYIVGECNRQNPILLLKVFLKCIPAIFKERPDVVISTGAAAGCMSCFLAKLFGAKVIWIDSITNVERLSLSGAIVRHIADLFLVQWPELTEKYKKTEFAGTVI